MWVRPCCHLSSHVIKKKKKIVLCLKIISKKKKKRKKKFQIFFPKNNDDVIKDFDFFSKNLKHFDSLTFWRSLKTIDLFTDSDAILKILSVDFCRKVKVNSDSSSKTV